ncbi:MAG: hypothetical protein H6Q90_4303 [Deltaproteobacteria bacterium]|nr:hypothetical protein [Deltaproteobacteria bacterium]
MLPCLHEHGAQVLFALADPLALELGARNDRDRGAERGRHRLGEQRLAGAGRAPEDHAARDQALDPRDLFGIRELVLRGEDRENLGGEPLLDRRVAADVGLEVDRGQLDIVGQRRGAQLGERTLRVDGVVLAGDRTEQPAEPDRVDSGDVLVEIVRIEAAPELAGLALGDEVAQAIARDADDRFPVREQVLDRLGQRERRILESEPQDLRVLVEQRDDLARLGAEPAAAAARGEDVEVR